MNLKETREGYMEGFGWKKRERKCDSMTILKNKHQKSK